MLRRLLVAAELLDDVVPDSEPDDQVRQDAVLFRCCRRPPATKKGRISCLLVKNKFMTNSLVILLGIRKCGVVWMEVRTEEEEEEEGGEEKEKKRTWPRGALDSILGSRLRLGVA